MIAEAPRTLLELYDDIVKPLMPVEQIAFARLILADLPSSMVDESGEWSEQDLQDWSRSGRQYLEAVLGDSRDA